mgnify:CR=1 FL=1
MSGIIGVSPNMKSGLIGKYPAGHLIQTEYMSYSAYKTWPNSQAYTTTNVTDSITVKEATSKILVLIALNATVYDGADAAYYKLDESTTSLSVVLDTYFGAATSNCTSAVAHYQYYHDHNQSGGTTLTYTVNMRAHSSNASGIRINDHFVANNEVSSMTLMEIAQ